MNKNEEKKNITYGQAAAGGSVVELLESGELTLEDSIRMFEKGIELVRFCNKSLMTSKSGSNSY